MAKLLRNELTFEIIDGKMHSKRVIEDVQELHEFVEIVDKTEADLDFMKQFVENYDETRKERIRSIKAELIRKHAKPDVIKKALEQDEMGMQNQKQAFEKRDIPNIESEIEKLRAAKKLALEANK